MGKDSVARIATATITFYPVGETIGIELGYQQSVNLTKSSEKKEIFSNDEQMGETVVEVETKSTYEFATEIGDLSLPNLSLAFKGLVESKTYLAGETFVTGKTIKANTAAAAIGDLILDATATKIYVAIEAITAAGFNVAKCAPSFYNATVKRLRPEVRKNNLGKIVVDGVNLATNKAQILVIPSINLSFDGDFGVSGSDFAKISLKGRCLKKAGEDLFTLVDA